VPRRCVRTAEAGAGGVTSPVKSARLAALIVTPINLARAHRQS